MRWLVPRLLCIGLMWTTAHAQSAAPAAGEPYQFCAQGSDEFADASKRIGALTQQIRALKPDSDHRAANDALLSLMNHPCMQTANVTREALRAEAAPALIDFWVQGWLWTSRVLDLGDSREQRFAPPMRKVLTPQTRPGFPAPSLLCPLADETCGQETQGWWLRADVFLRQNARQVLYEGPVNEQVCRDRALARPEAERYDEWRSCIAAARKLTDVLPLGRVKSPTAGWLVVRGRRGHYTFCDEVRMYSLATGSAYISQRCSALALGRGTPAVESGVLRGAVSIENLREVAWMLLQLAEVTSDYPVDNDAFRVPDGVALMRPPPSAQPEADGEWVIIDSSQTGLAWTLLHESGVEFASGGLTWPRDHNRVAANHATGLLQVAEGGFKAGCPPERPPAITPDRGRSWVSPADANVAALAQTEEFLVAELQRVAQSECAQEP